MTCDEILKRDIRNNGKYKKLKEQIGKCELCWSVRGLEVHHIIPKVCEIDDIDFECDANLIVLCSSCHGKLTSKSLLTKYGQQKMLNRSRKLVKFYTELGEFDGYFDIEDVFNEVNKVWG